MEKNTSKIILVGGGGHCKSCIDVLESTGKYFIEGVIDLPHLLGSETLGHKVIGNDDDLPDLAKKGYSFLITLGHMGNPTRRNEILNIIKTNGGKLPVIISPNAYVSKHAKVGNGTIIMHGAVVNAHAIIEENCIINSLSLIEHDTRVGNSCHISTGAIINGNCVVGENSFIGSGTTVKNGTSISKNCIIGSGSNVVKDVTVSGKYFGNPLKKQGE